MDQIEEQRQTLILPDITYMGSEIGRGCLCGPKSETRTTKVWGKSRAKDLNKTAYEMAQRVMNNFYLRGCWPKGDQCRIPPEMVVVAINDISGGGKHCVSKLVNDNLKQFVDVATLFSEEEAANLPCNLAKIRLREKGLLTGPLDKQNLTLSLAAEIETIKRLGINDKKYYFSWRGTLSILENMIVVDHGVEIGEFLEKHSKLTRGIYGSDLIDNIVLGHATELEEVWRMMADWVSKGKRRKDNWVTFPYIDLPSPITAVSNLSVETCWKLQECPGKIRVDSRPWSSHPFSKGKMAMMRLLMVAMTAKFPDMFFTYGSFRKDFEEGGARQIAEEVLQKGFNLYLQHRSLNQQPHGKPVGYENRRFSPFPTRSSWQAKRQMD